MPGADTGREVMMHKSNHTVNNRHITSGNPTEGYHQRRAYHPSSLCSRGRATVEIPKAKVDLQPSLTKRLKYVAKIKKKFWDKWMD
jgi:hypothetical protein